MPISCRSRRRAWTISPALEDAVAQSCICRERPRPIRSAIDSWPLKPPRRCRGTFLLPGTAGCLLFPRHDHDERRDYRRARAERRVGKTTLLKLIGGELRPDGGRVLVSGRDVHRLSQSGLYALRRRMGVLFQAGAPFHRSGRLRQRRIPLREHTRLSEERSATWCCSSSRQWGCAMPVACGRGAVRGMARRVALARAIAIDPEIVLYDEPLAARIRSRPACS